MWEPLRWWRTAQEMADDFARKHRSQPDAEFLVECGLTDAPKAALAVRRSVAKYGMVKADHIHPDHDYPGAFWEPTGGIHSTIGVRDQSISWL